MGIPYSTIGSFSDVLLKVRSVSLSFNTPRLKGQVPIVFSANYSLAHPPLIYTYRYIYMYICIYVCMVSLHINIYIYTHTYMFTYTCVHRCEHSCAVLVRSQITSLLDRWVRGGYQVGLGDLQEVVRYAEGLALRVGVFRNAGHYWGV